MLILADDGEAIQRLINSLGRRGFTCTLAAGEEVLPESEPADLLLIEAGSNYSTSMFREMVQRIKINWHIPVVLLTDKEILRDLENNNDISDFILQPYDIDELSTRVRRLLQKNTLPEASPDYLKAGDVVVDVPRCEVTVSGKVVDLTFTEYELIKLLISKKGQVLTREVLLNKIWGYDYFGGDRTVDVHITRLRNKIEDTAHGIIETVRNIGYRVRTDEK